MDSKQERLYNYIIRIAVSCECNPDEYFYTPDTATAINEDTRLARAQDVHGMRQNTYVTEGGMNRQDEPARIKGTIMKKTVTKQDIIRMVEEEGVRFIRLQFADVFGSLKNVAIPSSALENALDNKCMFDGSAIEGFVRIEESDMYLYPDLNTFQIFPWDTGNGKTARILCDIYRPEGLPFEGDSRYVLKKVLKTASRMGYTLDVGPECEFFLFHTDENGQPTTVSHEKAGYFDMAPLDLFGNTRRDIILALESMDIQVEASHHEVAPSQHEIDLRYENAIVSADHIMTFRMIAKTIAKHRGLYASFMPKPLNGTDGSGMHYHMSLNNREGKNVFYSKDDPMNLSEECYCFIGGLMEHARGMSLITNPLVNSYKRLVPGYEAPVSVAWSFSNRSPLIRIPAARGQSTRVELRSPDSASNPYLVMALALAAGLDGIERGIKPPDPIGKNLYQISPEQSKKLHVRNLPTTLTEACEAFKEDPFVRKILGDHISTKYLKAKQKEWEEYHGRVSEWEREEYLYKY